MKNCEIKESLKKIVDEYRQAYKSSSSDHFYALAELKESVVKLIDEEGM